MAEFTGERLIPGQVDVDLLNEHVARYAFAARLARGKRVLDAGCGSGYGSAELARVAQWVVGVDVAPEAVDFAAANYRLPNLRFERASCAALPHRDGAFDLVVSFEVLEHLQDWRAFLSEARRVLTPTGQFIVSTPNKYYYAESRGPSGSNPFHVHEFDCDELRRELKAVFPYVSMFYENHVDGLAFQPDEPDSAVEACVAAGRTDPANSHFFVAVCAHRSQLGNPTFLYVPAAANVLRERERHIALLEAELATKNEWLEKSAREHAEALELLNEKEKELRHSNDWAAGLDRDLAGVRARVVGLQEELAREQGRARDAITRLEKELRQEQTHAQETIARMEKELRERADWAFSLQAELDRLNERLRRMEGSKWVRLGRTLRLGPAA